MIALTLIAVGAAMMATAALWSAKIKETQRESRRLAESARDKYEAARRDLDRRIVLDLRVEYRQSLQAALETAARDIRTEAQRRFYGRERRFSDEDFAALLRDANHDDLDWRE